jgi:hypothetical protein
MPGHARPPLNDHQDPLSTEAVQQGSTATGMETSRLRWTSMDGQQVLDQEFSNVGSMRLQDGMQKVRPVTRSIAECGCT